MENGKIVAINTIAQYFGKAIAVTLSVLVTMFLTRSLGVSSYGNYILVLNIVMFGNAIAEWGMTFIATREAAKVSNEAKWFDAVLFTRVASGLVVALILGGFWSYFAKGVDLNVGILGVSLIMILALKSWLQVIFQTQMSLWKLTIVDTISTIFFGGCVILLSYQGWANLLNVVLSLVISATASVVIGLLFVFGTRYRPSFKIEQKLIYKLVQESLIMGAVLIIFSVYNKVDVFILRAIRGDSEVGVYGLAYKVYENVIIGAAFFANSLFPLLAKKSKIESEFRRVLVKSLVLLLGGGLLFATATWILAPFVIDLLGGFEYKGAVVALRWLCLAIVFAYLNHGLGYATIALGKQKVSAIIAGVGLTVNLAANYLLIPRFGFVAAAQVTGLTEGTVLVLTAIYLWRRFAIQS